MLTFTYILLALALVPLNLFYGLSSLFVLPLVVLPIIMGPLSAHPGNRESRMPWFVKMFRGGIISLPICLIASTYITYDGTSWGVGNFMHADSAPSSQIYIFRLIVGLTACVLGYVLGSILDHFYRKDAHRASSVVMSISIGLIVGFFLLSRIVPGLQIELQID